MGFIIEPGEGSVKPIPGFGRVSFSVRGPEARFRSRRLPDFVRYFVRRLEIL